MPSSILREGSKGAGKAEDFIGSDITALRICFWVNSDIRITASGTTRTEGLALKGGFLFSKMTGIDSGQTGIIVNLAGSERGVDDGEGGGGITEGASQYPWLYVYQHTVVRETQRCAASCHCLPVEIRYHS